MADFSERKEIAYRSLIDAAKSLSSASDVDQLVGRILASSRDVMQCRACSICLPDSVTGDLLIRGTQPELQGRILRVPAGKGIAGRVFRSRKSENTLNAQRDADHYAGIGVETQTPAYAMLTIPVMDAGVCHGVMQALNPADRDRFDDFDEEVFMAFGALIAATLTRMQVQEAAMQQELDAAYRQAELSVARRAQNSFMPPPQFSCRGLQIRAFQEQAAEIGGDFFTYYELGDGSLLVAVGDASGKGIPAALESARVCTLIALKISLCTFAGFPEWIADVNETLRQTAERAGALTTLAVLLVDRDRRWLRSCSFGQFRPRYFSVSRGWQELDCEISPPLGVPGGDHFAVRTVPFALGCSWLLLTDGFIEARSATGEQFGERALARSLSESAATGQEPLSVLEKNWRESNTASRERDDATALLLTATSDGPPRLLSLELLPDRMADARAFFQAWAEAAGLNEDDVYQVVLACDEILTNLYKHAYHGQGGPLRCEAAIEPHGLTFLITHFGEGLSQEEYTERLIRRLPVSDPSCGGGYGLPFIRQVFSDVNFASHGSGSTVAVTRRIPAPA